VKAAAIVLPVLSELVITILRIPGAASFKSKVAEMVDPVTTVALDAIMSGPTPVSLTVAPGRNSAGPEFRWTVLWEHLILEMF
jgi:hypothetical protein